MTGLSRNKLRTIGILTAVLALVVTIALIDRYSKSAPKPALVELGEVNELELVFRGKRAVFDKDQKQWQLVHFDERTVKDKRANQNLLNHLVDLAHTLSTTPTGALDPDDAKHYGMENPELSATFSWKTPKQGKEVILFGHRDLTERKVFAFFPLRPSLVEVQASAMVLLEGKSALDLRDRRITTFETDDVEDLRTSGKCSSLHLARDGDRWLKDGKSLETEKAESWLGGLLAIQYDAIDEFGVVAPEDATLNPVCAIELVGRKDRKETIQIFKSSGTLWSSNSQLPARYHLPEGVMKLLVL